jgi:hypothetical protein
LDYEREQNTVTIGISVKTIFHRSTYLETRLALHRCIGFAINGTIYRKMHWGHASTVVPGMGALKWIFNKREALQWSHHFTRHKCCDVQ